LRGGGDQEYSFFAAVPVLLAAGGVDLLESLPQLGRADLPLYLIGFIVSFLAAWVASGFLSITWRAPLVRLVVPPWAGVVVLGWWFAGSGDVTAGGRWPLICRLHRCAIRCPGGPAAIRCVV
jgi:hypothetical protein